MVTIALLAGGMACFGSATPVSAIVGRDLPVWLGSFLRMVVAATVLVPVLVAVQRQRGETALGAFAGLDRGDRWRLVAIAVVGTFGFSAFMLLGMQRAPGAVGAVVMATTPAGRLVAALGGPQRWHSALTGGSAICVAGRRSLCGQCTDQRSTFGGQSMRTLANTCQASADFAVRLRIT